FVNKDAPGAMRMKLIEVVKRIPFQKVEINVDPSLNEEAEEETEGGEQQATTGVPEAPPLDAGALKHQLTGLVQRIPQVLATDPSRKDSLLALAKEAEGDLAADLAAAADAIARLEAALNGAGTGNGGAKDAGEHTQGAVNY